MPSYLITGASRGLGLGFAAELLKNKNNTVVATARDTAGSSGLQNLKAQGTEGKLVLMDLDVSKPASIRAAAEKATQLLPGGLDNLISNAGVSYNGMKSFEELKNEEFLAEVNFTISSTLLLVQEFLPLVQKSEVKRILVISSNLGSIQLANVIPGVLNAYSVARAALNMLVRKWSGTLKGDGVTIALLHPGWVGVTEIGDGITEWVSKYAPSLENVPVERSAAESMKVLNNLTIEDTGAFFNFDGTQLPF